MAFLSNSVEASSVGSPCRSEVDLKFLQSLQHQVGFLDILFQAGLHDLLFEAVFRFAVVAIGVEGFDHVLSDELFSRVAAICFLHSVYDEKTNGVDAQVIEFQRLNDPSSRSQRVGRPVPQAPLVPGERNLKWETAYGFLSFSAFELAYVTDRLRRDSLK
jgi:hypothetical protein